MIALEKIWIVETGRVVRVEPLERLVEDMRVAKSFSVVINCVGKESGSSNPSSSFLGSSVCSANGIFVLPLVIGLIFSEGSISVEVSAIMTVGVTIELKVDKILRRRDVALEVPLAVLVDIVGIVIEDTSDVALEVKRDCVF